MRRMILSALLLFCAASTHAAIYDLGELKAGHTYAIESPDIVGPFDDFIKFTTTGNSIFQYDASHPNMLPFSVIPYGVYGSPSSLGISIVGGPGLWEIKGIGGATVFSGGSSSFEPGHYYFQFSPVVPEPGTWLMLLAGAGLMGWRLRQSHATCDRR